MTDIVQKFINERSAQNLPKTAKTRSGIEFYPNESLWVFRDGTTQLSLSFDLLPDECLPLNLGFKKTLLWYLENRAPSTAKQQFHNFIWLARRLAEIQGGVIERVSLEAILTVKMLSDAAEHRLAGIRAFLVKWGELGGGGIDSRLVGSLGHLTLKQFPVGVAVATLDPNKGPLTDLEFEAIQSAVNNAYARSEINLESLLLCYLFMSLGVRPIQLASMKCCDLIVPETSGGDYVLRVPRVKQREKMARTEFKFRKLTRQIGEALSHYVEMIVAEFDGKLDDAREAPLFPQRVQVDNANARDFKYHITSSSLSNRLVRLFASLLVSSERLDGAISVSPLRLRRTFATRAAEEGWPLLVIAELMDHESTKHVAVYAGLTARIRGAFSRKIAMDMAPLAKVFSGRIIRSEVEATRPGPVSRIIDLRVDRGGASMGNCGCHVHCSFARPIACYAGCYDFEPWLDGPHEAALEYMLARREQLIANADSRIASINDRAILGCSQIILRCNQILSKGEL